MPVDFDKFLRWAESRWHDDVIVKGNEIKLNSPFCEDYKRHLWCNPSGGKKDIANGVYHCWKTDERGSLVGLVMHVDKCSYDEALDTLDQGDISLAEMEKQLEDILFNKKTVIIEPKKDEDLTLDFPIHCSWISDLPENDFFKDRAELYLKSRKLSSDRLLVCTGGDYKNRIIIPYLDKEYNLIYFNGRYIGNSEKALRYMGPPKEIGVGKSDVIFMTSWGKPGQRVYCTEGEFDALSIAETGHVGAALGGKELSERQAMYLMPYIPVLCPDNDSSGKRALPKMGDFLRSQGLKEIYYVRPPKQYKDWNEFLVKHDAQVMSAYMEKNIKSYGDWTGEELKWRDV